MATFKAFSFGYYGWGHYTRQLLETADALETSRGHAPPVFVDVRYKRHGRAVGFVGTNFEKLAGANRYRWMQGLGNKNIGTDGAIAIASPGTSLELLETVKAAAAENRRVLFFCACLAPKTDNCMACHRVAVAKLLRNAGSMQGHTVDVQEWPGGDPLEYELEVSPRDFASINAGGWTINMRGRPDNFAELAGIPWCSIASISSGRRTIHRLIGPLQHRAAGWCLPIAYQLDNRDADLQDYRDAVAEQALDWTP